MLKPKQTLNPILQKTNETQKISFPQTETKIESNFTKTEWNSKISFTQTKTKIESNFTKTERNVEQILRKSKETKN